MSNAMFEHEASERQRMISFKSVLILKVISLRFACKMEKSSEMASKFDEAVKKLMQNYNCSLLMAEKCADHIRKIKNVKIGAKKKV